MLLISRRVSQGDRACFGFALKQLDQIVVFLEFLLVTQAALICRLLGKTGVDLRHELRGEPVFLLELIPKLPKSIARTASLGAVSENRELLLSHLLYHTTRLAVELVTKRYAANRVTVFLERQSFESLRVEEYLAYPTSNYFTLAKAVRHAFEALYRSGTRYSLFDAD